MYYYYLLKINLSKKLYYVIIETRTGVFYLVKGVFDMKATGIVRKVDDLGRIVIPIELRRSLGIEIKDSMEIFVDKEMIMLRKYTASCSYCDNVSDLTVFKEKNICKSCLEELKSL